MTVSTPPEQKLAIDGGTPLRNTPFAPWPFYAQDEIDAVRNVLASGKVNYWTGGECDEITIWLFPPFALNSAAASTVEKLVAKATAELLEEVSVRQTSWSLEMKITRKNETSSRHSGQR